MQNICLFHINDTLNHIHYARQIIAPLGSVGIIQRQFLKDMIALSGVRRKEEGISVTAFLTLTY